VRFRWRSGFRWAVLGPARWAVPRGPVSRSVARERGSGSVLVIALIETVLVLTMFVGVAGRAAVARHRAESAADLAALAAASSPDGASAESCRRAAAAAQSGGGVLSACRSLVDGSVLVEVVVPVPELARWLSAKDGARPPFQAKASARAGPPSLGASPVSDEDRNGASVGIRGRMCAADG
jgi:secretion/DNA translocation related TadE-like protein